MLYSALEPSCNLLENFSLLPLILWIRKLIVDMVNDSTPLILMKNTFFLAVELRTMRKKTFIMKGKS